MAKSSTYSDIGMPPRTTPAMPLMATAKSVTLRIDPWGTPFSWIRSCESASPMRTRKRRNSKKLKSHHHHQHSRFKPKRLVPVSFVILKLFVPAFSWSANVPFTCGFVICNDFWYSVFWHSLYMFYPFPSIYLYFIC